MKTIKLKPFIDKKMSYSRFCRLFRKAGFKADVIVCYWLNENEIALYNKEDNALYINELRGIGCLDMSLESIAYNLSLHFKELEISEPYENIVITD